VSSETIGYKKDTSPGIHVYAIFVDRAPKAGIGCRAGSNRHLRT
jgi:hypothetical protein